MKKLITPFLFSSSERRGVLYLVWIILLVQFLIFAVDFIPKKKNQLLHFDEGELSMIQHKIDSLKQDKASKNSFKIYPFNPNFITEYKAYQLGISATAYNKLKAFRAKDTYVNSANDFQKVTGISDSLLATIQPFFKFPEWTQNHKNKNPFGDNKEKSSFVKVQTNIEKKDLNTATKESLMEINGIGDKLSDRIIKYRTALKGFSYDSQLYEVWYLDKTVADKVLQTFTVLSQPKIEKININTASFKEVMHASPYIDYALTKILFDYKNAAGKIVSMDVLKKIDSFPVEKFDRISLYLKAE